MNYRVNKDPLAIIKTGAAALDGQVFTDLKIARAVIVDHVEAKIREGRRVTEAALIETRKRALAEDEAAFKAWRDQRDAVTTVREKDLPTEPAPEPATVTEAAE